MARRKKRKPEVGRDFFWDGERFVFTRDYLLSLGECCENDCPLCPYRDRTSNLHEDDGLAAAEHAFSAVR